MIRFLIAIFIALSLAACGGNDDPPPPVADTTAPAHWNAIALQTMANVATAAPPGLSPPEDSRIYAMAFGAAHDALNAIDRRYKPYLTDTHAPGANPDAAVAAAMHDVLKAQVPSQAAYLDDRYAESLAAVPAGEAKTAGIALGQQTAAAMLAARADDGSADANQPYTPGTAPGDYQVTPPINFAALVAWGQVTPYVMTSGSQFRPSTGPYAVTSLAYTQDYNEIKALGGATSTERTVDQSEIAKFWLENTSGTWARIAAQVADAKRLNGWEQARLFALTQMAVADAYIACLDAKYFYNFWRPITAIRAGDTDGNPDTVGDATWTPFDPVTPPIPDYVSGHASAAGAGAAVLKAVFGDAVTLSYTGTTLPGVTRSFTSFTQIADEIGASRVYVGYHFRHAVIDGLAQGHSVGEYAVAHALTAP